MSCRSHECPENVTDKVDTFEAALLRLTEAVAENSRKLDALMKHLGVPYVKRPRE